MLDEILAQVPQLVYQLLLDCRLGVVGELVQQREDKYNRVVKAYISCYMSHHFDVNQSARNGGVSYRSRDGKGEAEGKGQASFVQQGT